MTSEREIWYDDEAGPLVRPYAVTRGRTRGPTLSLQLITLVVATGTITRESRALLGPEHLQILSLCHYPTSVAELSAHFGRVTLNPSLVLYLFGTPGQDRFWFLWDELSAGAIGAVVLADTRRLGDCFPAVDYFEGRGLPFTIGVNCFDGAQYYTAEEVRAALDLAPHIPVLLCDVRERESGKDLLTTLVEYVITLIRES